MFTLTCIETATLKGFSLSLYIYIYIMNVYRIELHCMNNQSKQLWDHTFLVAWAKNN